MELGNRLTSIRVYLLSLVSNMIKKEKNSIKALQGLAQRKTVKAVSGLGWAVVWGPVVWKNDPNNGLTGPDHVWFVAKKLRRAGLPDIYGISAAGSATIYNLVVNNTGVIQVVDFTTWATNTPPAPTSTIVDSGTYVAFGTAQGVHTLCSYPAPMGAAGAGKTLSDFLRDLSRGSGTQFIFTGFSLGGTLSPTLALGLTKADAGVFTAADEILTYPIAGASPGNVHFAGLFAEKFPMNSGSGYQVWNGNVANTLDVVPQAWSTDVAQPQNLDKVPPIYGNNPVLPGVQQKVSISKDIACKSGIVYIPLQSTLFTAAAVTPPPDEKIFREIATEQHSKAYERYFNVKLPKGSSALRTQGGLEGSEAEHESAILELEGKVEDDQEEEDLFPDLVIYI